MKRRKLIRVTNSSAAAADGARSRIRNAYSARYLAVRALHDVESRRSRIIAETVSKWAADVSAVGAVDLAAAVRTAGACKSAHDLSGVQQDAVTSLLNLVAHQIEQFKKLDAPGVVAVLKERISRLQASQDQRGKEGSATQSELQHLLEELSAIDPEQPGYPKESRRPGPKKS